MKKSFIIGSVFLSLLCISLTADETNQIKGRCESEIGDNCIAFCPACACPYYSPNHGGQGILTRGLCEKDIGGGLTCGYNFETGEVGNHPFE